MTLPVKRDSRNPDPGTILKFKGLADVVVTAEAQARCTKLLDRASNAFHVGMKAWIVSASLLKTIRDEEIYRHLGFADFKTFLEKRFDGGRSTAFEYIKIAGAFPLPHDGESTMVDSELPALYELDWHKLSALARLPEEMRDALRENGKFTYDDNGESRIVSLDELRTMTREEVQNLVSATIENIFGMSGASSAGGTHMDEGQRFDHLTKHFENGFYSEQTLPLLEEMTELAPKLDSRARRSYANQIEDVARVITKYASAIRVGGKFSILPPQGKDDGGKA